MKRFLLALPFLFTGFAWSQAMCLTGNKIEEVISGLDMKMVAEGTSSEGDKTYKVQWYVNSMMKWFVVYVRDDPLGSCIVAYGDDFQLSLMDKPPKNDV